MEAIIRPLIGFAGILIAIDVVWHFVVNPSLIIQIAKNFGSAIASSFTGGGI